MTASMGYCTDMVTSTDGERLFLEEWMEELKVDDATLARRIGVDRVTVTRYRNGERGVNDRKVVEIARALGISTIQLWRHPSRPSVDAMLVDSSDEVIREAADHTALLLRRQK